MPRRGYGKRLNQLISARAHVKVLKRGNAAQMRTKPQGVLCDCGGDTRITRTIIRRRDMGGRKSSVVKYNATCNRCGISGSVLHGCDMYALGDALSRAYHDREKEAKEMTTEEKKPEGPVLPVLLNRDCQLYELHGISAKAVNLPSSLLSLPIVNDENDGNQVTPVLPISLK